MAIRALSFDAGGTLFSPCETVGETYARLARASGIEIDARMLEGAFALAFGLAPPLIVPTSARGADRLAAERGWWRDVVRATLAHALALDQPVPPDRFESFFEATFAHYAEPAAWRLHDDVLPCLEEVARRGLAAVVVSNFDSRLHRLLAGLGLAPLLRGAIASTEVGFAKPARPIFTAAASLLDTPPASCLHIGDSPEADAIGARRAGMTGVWLDRHDGGDHRHVAGVPRIRSLAELPLLLERLA